MPSIAEERGREIEREREEEIIGRNSFFAVLGSGIFQVNESTFIKFTSQSLISYLGTFEPKVINCKG